MSSEIAGFAGLDKAGEHCLRQEAREEGGLAAKQHFLIFPTYEMITPYTTTFSATERQITCIGEESTIDSTNLAAITS